MVWHDLLFLHWPVPTAALRRLIPDALELETFRGDAWLAVVPFHMSGIRLRGFPGIPGQSAFPELNVRTYVRYRDCPGVWFFSLDAANPLAVRIARATFHLNYLDAAMTCVGDGDGIRYESRRTHRGAADAALRVRYRPAGPPRPSPSGSLEHWMTERYSLYAMAPGGAVLRGDIRHAPWALQPAEAEVTANTMTEGLGIELVGPPLSHFVRRLDVLATRAKRVG